MSLLLTNAGGVNTSAPLPILIVSGVTAGSFTYNVASANGQPGMVLGIFSSLPVSDPNSAPNLFDSDVNTVPTGDVDFFASVGDALTPDTDFWVAAWASPDESTIVGGPSNVVKIHTLVQAPPVAVLALDPGDVGGSTLNMDGSGSTVDATYGAPDYRFFAGSLQADGGPVPTAAIDVSTLDDGPQTAQLLLDQWDSQEADQELQFTMSGGVIVSIP